jgi:hypothetical protein
MPRELTLLRRRAFGPPSPCPLCGTLAVLYHFSTEGGGLREIARRDGASALWVLSPKTAFSEAAFCSSTCFALRREALLSEPERRRLSCPCGWHTPAFAHPRPAEDALQTHQVFCKRR